MSSSLSSPDIPTSVELHPLPSHQPVPVSSVSSSSSVIGILSTPETSVDSSPIPRDAVAVAFSDIDDTDENVDLLLPSDSVEQRIIQLKSTATALHDFWNSRPLCRGICQTLVLMFVYVTAGFVNSMFTPLISQLADNISAPNDDVEWVITSRNLGRLISPFFAIPLFWIVRKSRSEVVPWWFPVSTRVLSLLCLLMAGMIAITPFLGSVALLIVVFGVQGFLFEMIEIGLNAVIPDVWTSRLDATLQILHGAYAVGTCVFPFVEAWIFKIRNVRMRLVVAFSLCGCFLVIAAISLVLIPAPRCPEDQAPNVKCCSCANQEDGKDVEERGGTTTENSGQIKQFFAKIFRAVFSTATLVVILAAVIKGTSVGCYDTYAPMLNLFATENMLGSETVLSYLTFSFWATFAIGRISNVLIILIVKSAYTVLWVNSCILISLFLSLSLGAAKNLYSLWVLSCFIGFFVGPLSPYAVGICQSFFEVHVSPVSVGIAYVGSNIGALVMSVVVNTLWERTNRNILFYSGIGLFLVGILTLVTMGILKYRQSQCCREGRTPLPDGDEEEEMLSDIDMPSIPEDSS